METYERRNISQRAALVQRLVTDVIRHPGLVLRVDTLQKCLNVPADAAQRILRRLVASGVIRAIGNGLWIRTPWVRTHLVLVDATHL